MNYTSCFNNNMKLYEIQKIEHSFIDALRYQNKRIKIHIFSFAFVFCQKSTVQEQIFT